MRQVCCKINFQCPFFYLLEVFAKDKKYSIWKSSNFIDFSLSKNYAFIYFKKHLQEAAVLARRLFNLSHKRSWLAFWNIFWPKFPTLPKMPRFPKLPSFLRLPILRKLPRLPQLPRLRRLPKLSRLKK